MLIILLIPTFAIEILNLQELLYCKNAYQHWKDGQFRVCYRRKEEVGIKKHSTFIDVLLFQLSITFVYLQFGRRPWSVDGMIKSPSCDQRMLWITDQAVDKQTLLCQKIRFV